MPKNVGTIDRVVRVIIAVVLIYYAIFQPVSTALRLILGIICLVLIITALTGSCYLYKIFGISTKKENKSLSQSNQPPSIPQPPFEK